MENTEFDYLQLLSKSYPNIQSAATEIINLKAILNLPKPTEHFLSDIHGEYEAFNHILRSGSGVIKEKIDETFPSYTPENRNLLATIIYYPTEKLNLLRKEDKLTPEFFKQTLSDLVDILKVVASKFTRSKIRKAMSPDFSYVIEEMMQSHDFVLNKEKYYAEITQSIIDTGRAEAFIHEMSKLIQKLSVDHLHVLGDIYDRGPSAHKIMDVLMNHHHCDITWGNHDILYMGAALGNWACIANVVAATFRHGTLSTLEDGYGISLRPLVTFAIKTYEKDPPATFKVRSVDSSDSGDYSARILAKMHKAIVVLGFKLESQLIDRHGEYDADYLDKWSRINFPRGFAYLNNVFYPLEDTYFPSVDLKNPSALTEDEVDLMETLANEFVHSAKLKAHLEFLITHGSMYLTNNGNLLFHGCIPMEKNGRLSKMFGRDGKELLDYFDKLVREAYYAHEESQRQRLSDIYWYLSCGKKSPIFGKDDILTFEKYFIKDYPGTEELNPYFTLSDEVAYATRILEEFGFYGTDARIINGHMPVKLKEGQSPIRAEKRRLVIDGGICKAYQKVTGIAGYTLIYNSHGMKLIGHQMFTSKESAIHDDVDIIHSKDYLDGEGKRWSVADTDQGKRIQKNMNDLWALLQAYRSGLLKSKE